MVTEMDDRRGGQGHGPMADVIGETRRALKHLDPTQIEQTVTNLRHARNVFVVGNGGGMAHATHFAADLRKIAHKPAFSFDSLPEMTARINDDGLNLAWLDWRKTLGFEPAHDVTFIFSVGGAIDGVSTNLAVLHADYGIVGANGARGNRIVIPSTSTPVIEGCQSVIAHALVEMLAA